MRTGINPGCTLTRAWDTVLRAHVPSEVTALSLFTAVIYAPTQKLRSTPVELKCDGC